MTVEKTSIKKALEITEWNKSKAALMLEIDYKTLPAKIKGYRIVRSV
ncbi:MAG TPA: hypothetical protein DHV16_00530 [Nitrospiraceae bacterium]|nr:hypothetical protein [Nitrospiraceae bacterium]HCZ10753.1 hypothetical protein [Nitrospiraceae bacterium]